MTQFNWQISRLVVTPMEAGEADVVINASWSCNGVSNDGSAGAGGSVEFTYSGGPFTPYDQLTQDQVLGWVWASPDFSKTQVEADIQATIDAQIPVFNPTPPLPWQTPQGV